MDIRDVSLESLFSVETLQFIQDQFSKATGVASVITQPDGKPITRPSNFCRLCERVIRSTEKGRRNCFHSDAVIGRHNPSGPTVSPCLSGGLWDAGASITVNGHHIANWLIGQVRNEAQTDESMRAYAREIGVDEQAFLDAFHEVPVMSLERFQQIAQFLFTLAEQLSSTAYQNVVQSRFIEERNRTEADLIESESRLKAVLEGSQLGFWDWDIATDTVRRNDSWIEKLGYARLEIGPSMDHWLGLVHPDDRARVQQSIRDHLDGITPQHACEYRIRTERGGVRWILDQARVVSRTREGAPARMSGTHADITDRKHAELTQREIEDQRHRQQKLEGLIKLAGGIAHDFNNLLQALTGTLDILSTKRPSDGDEQTLNDIVHMQSLCRRMAGLSRQMQVCSGGLVFVPCVLDVNRLVMSALHELQPLLRDGVALAYHLTPGLPAFKGDEHLLLQALRNLFVNANDALEGRPGTVEVRTSRITLDALDLSSAAFYSGPSGGEFVTLEVIDTGCGIDDDAKQRLFDPFFTTKPSGRGLGLAEVMGIMRAHQGAIFVDSVAGKGTAVRLAWPCQQKAPAEHPPAVHPPTFAAAKPPAPAPRSHSFTILVVDDEPSVLDITERLLGTAGHRVLKASDGREGVDAFQQAAGEIDLVLLDLTMPKLDGVQALREIRAIRADVPIIIASGYSEQDILRRFGDDRPSAFLQKPYLSETLFRCVNELVKKPAH